MIKAKPEELQEAAITAFDKATVAPKDSQRWQRAIARAGKSFSPTLTWSGKTVHSSSSRLLMKSTRPTARASAERI